MRAMPRKSLLAVLALFSFIDQAGAACTLPSGAYAGSAAGSARLWNLAANPATEYTPAVNQLALVLQFPTSSTSTAGGTAGSFRSTGKTSMYPDPSNQCGLGGFCPKPGAVEITGTIAGISTASAPNAGTGTWEYNSSTAPISCKGKIIFTPTSMKVCPTSSPGSTPPACTTFTTGLSLYVQTYYYTSSASGNIVTLMPYEQRSTSNPPIVSDLIITLNKQ